MASALNRRLARIEAAHAQASARNRWRCMVDDCPQARVWQAADPDTKAVALAAADRHYDERHAEEVAKPSAPPATVRPTT